MKDQLKRNEIEPGEMVSKATSEGNKKGSGNTARESSSDGSANAFPTGSKKDPKDAVKEKVSKGSEKNDRKPENGPPKVDR